MSITAINVRNHAGPALSPMAHPGRPIRVLIVPGLHGSGRTHWQSWLQPLFRRSARAEQDDWAEPDLARWSARIGEVVESDPDASWVAVGHSFGCLALAHHLGRQPARDDAEPRVAAALFVAPAEPQRFGIAEALPAQRLHVPSSMLISSSDPWMTAASAAAWARTWGSGCINLGDAGHINVEAGFGPLPQAKHLTGFLIRRVEQSRRLSRAHVRELSFSV